MSRKFLIGAALALATAVFPLPAHALFFRLDGDRIWLQAHQTPLADVLSEFARAGVAVRLDPRIRSSVTAAFRGADLDSALESILSPHNYLLTWKVLRGPLGQVPKLHEILVFLPGERSAALPIPGKANPFESSRGVSGNAPEFVKDELLVGVRPGTSYARFQILLDQIGGMIVDADASTGAYLVRFPAGTNVEALLAQLAGNPLVARAELNHVFRLPDRPGSSAASGKTPLPVVRPPADGSIPVAVLDSGLDPRAGLSPIVSASWDAVDPDRPLSDPDGHGTHMAMLAGGILPADGLSPGDVLPVVAVRAFDADGKTSSFAIMQSLAFAAQAGAKVVNMSWGSETDGDFMRAAMQVAAGRGLVLVAAAGNEPTGKPVYPAAYPQVLAVGGVEPDGSPLPISNRGDFVDLSAPATAVLPSASDGSPAAFAGTSIASAVVANALAQYCARHPGASAASAWSALKASLSPAPAGFGAGILDADALRRFLSP